MNATTALGIQPYRPHTPDEFPHFTPQEMGDRVLKLIDSLESPDDLTLQHIIDVTGFPMEQTPPPWPRYTFKIHLPDSGWYYGLDFYRDLATKEGVVLFRFGNKDDDKDIYHLPDMTPVCLDFYAYVEALEHMGFEKTYDEYHDLGWILATYYKRKDVGVQITERREANQPESKRTHACLKSISFG